ncbi:MAG: chalcone isomerase family protein [Brachymonas sp.]
MTAAFCLLRNTLILIALSAGLIPGSALFSYANAPVAPQAVLQGIGSAKVQGQARLKVYGFNIYDAKLWVSEGFSAENYAQEPFALELKYLRNFSGEMIAERSLKEMQRIGDVSAEKSAQWLDVMKKTFPDVKKGDQLIGIHRPDGSASFVLNGKSVGEVKDAQFNRLFFGIWLSPKSSEPKMRRELIGANSGDAK